MLLKVHPMTSKNGIETIKNNLTIETTTEPPKTINHSIDMYFEFVKFLKNSNNSHLLSVLDILLDTKKSVVSGSVLLAERTDIEFNVGDIDIFINDFKYIDLFLDINLNSFGGSLIKAHYDTHISIYETTTEYDFLIDNYVIKTFRLDIHSKMNLNLIFIEYVSNNT